MSEAAFRAVSADSHVNPPADMWREYLPAEFRDRAPTVERTDEGDFEVFEGQRRPMMALAAAGRPSPRGVRHERAPLQRGPRRRVGAGGPHRGPGHRRRGRRGAVRRGGGRAAAEPGPGLTRAGLHRVQPLAGRLLRLRARPPDRHGLHPVRRPRRRHRRGRAASADAACGARCSPTSRRHGRLDRRGVVAVPGARLVELGLAGAPPRGWVGEHRRRRADSRRPVHRTTSSRASSTCRCRSARSCSAACSPSTPTSSSSRSKARSAGSRSGSTTSTTSTRSTAGTRTCHLPELPSTYVERQMWFTFMEDPPGIEARHACGIDRIMWSNDYPHSETTWPHSQKIIGEHLRARPRRRGAQDRPRQLRRALRARLARSRGDRRSRARLPDQGRDRRRRHRRRAVRGRRRDPRRPHRGDRRRHRRRPHRARRVRAPRHARVRRPAHALRRAAALGRLGDAVEPARCDHRDRGQLRVHAGAAQGRGRPLHAAHDGARRGDADRVAPAGTVVGVAQLRRVPRPPRRAGRGERRVPRRPLRAPPVRARRGGGGARVDSRRGRRDRGPPAGVTHRGRARPLAVAFVHAHRRRRAPGAEPPRLRRRSAHAVRRGRPLRRHFARGHHRRVHRRLRRRQRRAHRADERPRASPAQLEPAAHRVRDGGVRREPAASRGTRRASSAGASSRSRCRWRATAA